MLEPIAASALSWAYTNKRNKQVYAKCRRIY